MKQITTAAAAALLAAIPAFAQIGAPPKSAPLPSGAPTAKPAGPIVSKTPAETKLEALTPAERAQFEAHSKALGLDPKALAGQDLMTAQKQMAAKQAEAKMAEAKKASMLNQAASQMVQGSPKVLGTDAQAQAAAQKSAQAQEALRQQQLQQIEKMKQLQMTQSQQVLKLQEEMIVQMNDILTKMNAIQSSPLRSSGR